MSIHDGFYTLEPEVAGRKPLEEMWLTLPEVMRAFGLSWEELRAELVAGRLVASGRPNGDGYSAVHIRCDGVARWMAETGHHFVL
jgi:hypothetical protein